MRLAAGLPRLDGRYAPPAGAVSADEADALLARLGGPEAALDAVAVLRRVGPGASWPEPWRDALQALRGSADAAWLVDAGSGSLRGPGGVRAALRPRHGGPHPR